MTRREFIKKSFQYGTSLLLLTLPVELSAIDPLPGAELREALFYSKLASKTVQCRLCFRQCTISNKKRGFCRSRENREGNLYTLTYNLPAAIHIDPVEKIPFLHFYPGSDALCIGTAGCNLKCLNCINWHFALKAPEEVDSLSYAPAEIIQMAAGRAVDIICFTYNEPTICFEYMLDVFKLAGGAGIKTVLHTNASLNTGPLEKLLPFVDAVVADLKAFSPSFYEKNCSARLEPVLDCLKTVKKAGVWLEVVNLLIPGRNDKDEELEKMCRWIAANLGTETPLQFSRFFPTHKLTHLPPTPVHLLESACKLALKAGLKHVYIGNVPGIDQCHTYCPACGKILVERKGLFIKINNIQDRKCKFCNQLISGLW